MAVLEFAVLRNDGREALKGLFCSTFSASEGRQEGELIGELAAQLSIAMDDADVIGFGALQDQSLIGAIFFTILGVLLILQAFGVGTLVTTVQIITLVVIIAGVVLVLWSLMLRNSVKAS